MTITYLDEKPGMQDAATTVPALEATMVNPMASATIPVFQTTSIVKTSKRGRPKGSRNKTTRASARDLHGSRKGPGRPAKSKRGRPAKIKSGKSRIRGIRINKNKPTRKRKTMTTETTTATPIQTENRRGRKSEGKTCKLVCLITGSTRTAGSGYLSTKPAEFKSQYISRPALKLLRQGLNVQQVRESLKSPAGLPNISPEALQSAINLNGKHKK
jgi:hypothetical protein